MAQDLILAAYPNQQVSIVVYAILRLTLLVLWATPTAPATPASIPAAALSFVVSIALMPLSHLEHSREVSTSTILCFYLSLTALLDIAQVRSLWLQLGAQSTTAVFTASFAVRMIILLLETTNKRSALRPTYKDLSPEATGGIYIQCLFLWLNPLFWSTGN